MRFREVERNIEKEVLTKKKKTRTLRKSSLNMQQQLTKLDALLRICSIQ